MLAGCKSYRTGASPGNGLSWNQQRAHQKIEFKNGSSRKHHDSLCETSLECGAGPSFSLYSFGGNSAGPAFRSFFSKISQRSVSCLHIRNSEVIHF